MSFGILRIIGSRQAEACVCFCSCHFVVSIKRVRRLNGWPWFEMLQGLGLVQELEATALALIHVDLQQLQGPKSGGFQVWDSVVHGTGDAFINAICSTTHCRLCAVATWATHSDASSCLRCLAAWTPRPCSFSMTSSRTVSEHYVRGEGSVVSAASRRDCRPSVMECILPCYFKYAGNRTSIIL